MAQGHRRPGEGWNASSQALALSLVLPPSAWLRGWLAFAPDWCLFPAEGQ